MEVTLYLDKGDALREDGFFEAKVSKLKERVKSLEADCAELVKTNEELSQRCKELASSQPKWPAGYRPRRYKNNNQRKFNGKG